MTGATPNIDITPTQWAIVKSILLRHVPRYDIWIFGSRARRTAKPYSDLDLAIMTDQPLPLETRAALADDFSESDLPWKVDIVDWAAAPESFKQVIDQHKIIVRPDGAASGR
jgi:type I restriction enzyme S subunit